MRHSRPPYNTVEGKTYSLFGRSGSTREYYATIRELADTIVTLNPDISALLDEIRLFSRKRSALRQSLQRGSPGTRSERILNAIDPVLMTYTENVSQHLKSLSLSKMFDRTLSASREQYHLFMLEIELTNRLYIDDFIKCDRKIALMPYCLQDFTTECKSSRNGFDYQCRHCSGICFQNHASRILGELNIEPYIWMEGDMKQLAMYTVKEKRSLGILGIACIPELVNGMRSCVSLNIPVVGLPLNANRCRRWFGDFHPNSVDLDELERMLSKGANP